MPDRTLHWRNPTGTIGLAAAITLLAACSSHSGPGTPAAIHATRVGAARAADRTAAGCPAGYAACPGGGCCPDGTRCNDHTLCRRDVDEGGAGTGCPAGWFFDAAISRSFCYAPRVAAPEACSSDVPVACGALCCRVGATCTENGLCGLSAAEASICPGGSSPCQGTCCPDGSTCTLDPQYPSAFPCQAAPTAGSPPVPPTCGPGEVLVSGCCGWSAVCCPDIPGVSCDDQSCTPCAVAGVQATPCPADAPASWGGICCPAAAVSEWNSVCELPASSAACPPSAPARTSGGGCCPGSSYGDPASELCCGSGETACAATPPGCCGADAFCMPYDSVCLVAPEMARACPAAAPTPCGDLGQGAVCCPSDTTCLGEHACACPAARPVACGDDCLAAGESCPGCPADHPSLCVPSGECCLPGAACDDAEGCGCPAGTDRCVGSLGDSCCPPGALCDEGICLECPAKAPALCGGDCCPPGQG